MGSRWIAALLLAVFAACVTAPAAGFGGDAREIEVVPQLGNHSAVGLAMSSDGRYVLSTADNVVKLWDAQAGALIRTYKGGPCSGRMQTFVPGSLKVICDRSGELVLWDIKSGEILIKFEGGAFDGRLRISSDGSRIVNYYSRGLQAWSAVTGKELWTFSKPLNQANKRFDYDAVFSADNAKVLVIDDFELTTLDAATGRVISSTPAPSDYPFVFPPTSQRTAAFSSDGKWVVWGDWSYNTPPPPNIKRETFGKHDYIDASDPSQTIISLQGRENTFSNFGGLLKIKSTVAGAPTLKTIAVPAMEHIVFAPDGKHFLTLAGTTILWETATGKPVQGFDVNVMATAVVFTPDGKNILVGTIGGEISIWNIAEERKILAFGGTTTDVAEAIFLPGEQSFLSTAQSGLNIGELATGKQMPLPPVSRDAITTKLQLSPDGKWYIGDVLGNGVNALFLFDSATHKQIGQVDYDSVLNATMVPDGLTPAHALTNTALLVGGTGLTLWDAKTAHPIRTFAEKGFVRAVAITPDGRYAVSGGMPAKTATHTLKLWNAVTGEMRNDFGGFSDEVDAVAISSDGRYVVVSSANEGLQIRSAETGAAVYVNRDLTRGDVRFSPDGLRLLWVGSSFSPSAEGENGVLVRLFDTSDLAHPRELVAMPSKEWSNIPPYTFLPTRFSPDGSRLLLFRGSLIDIRDGRTGVLLRSLKGHENAVSSAAISQDGRRVISTARDGTVRLWDVESGREIVQYIGNETGEWLAITPDGYYNGSAHSDDLVAVVRGTEVYQISQFRQALYRPDLVYESVSGNRAKYVEAAKTLNLASIVDSNPAPTFQCRPPDRPCYVQTRLAGDWVHVDVFITVDPKGGIGPRLDWTLGGVALTTGKPEPMGEIQAVGRIEFHGPSQATTLEVTAYNAAGLQASLPLQIPIGASGKTGVDKHLFALVIGPDYAGTPLALKYSAKDAQDFADALREDAKARYVNPTVVALTGPNAKAEDIRRHFEVMAKGSDMGPDDVFVLFLAGHGRYDESDNQYYFYPQDYANRLISQKDLNAWLGPAQERIVIIDTCDSSAAIGGMQAELRHWDGIFQNLQHYTLGPKTGMLAASTLAAFEDERYQHGLLTYSLLASLGQKVPDDGSQLTFHNLVSDAVSKVSFMSHERPDREQQVSDLSVNAANVKLGYRVARFTPAPLPPVTAHVKALSCRARVHSEPDEDAADRTTPKGPIDVHESVDRGPYGKWVHISWKGGDGWVRDEMVVAPSGACPKSN